MAHYAFLNEDKVTEVIVGVDETELIEGLDPETWYGNFRNQVCKRTSYNGTIRKNYASIGMTYDSVRDAFIAEQPFGSWILNEDTCKWEAPVDRPTFDPEDPKYYRWDEATGSWVEIEPAS